MRRNGTAVTSQVTAIYCPAEAAIFVELGQTDPALSERRAAAAADYLVVLGVKKDRIDTRGRGEQEPIARNATERGRELNRRLEIAIFASEEYRAEVAAR